MLQYLIQTLSQMTETKSSSLPHHLLALLLWLINTPHSSLTPEGVKVRPRDMLQIVRSKVSLSALTTGLVMFCCHQSKTPKGMTN